MAAFGSFLTQENYCEEGGIHGCDMQTAAGGRLILLDMLDSTVYLRH